MYFYVFMFELVNSFNNKNIKNLNNNNIVLNIFIDFYIFDIIIGQNYAFIYVYF